VEKLGNAGQDGNVSFSEVLLVSGGEGQVGRPQSEATVTGRVLGEGRGDKVLVFHYKRKKQYKKMFGHRQPYTAVRITEIAFDGQRYTAPEEPRREFKGKKAAGPEGSGESAAEHESKAPKVRAEAGGTTGAGKKTAGTRHGGGSKTTGSKSKGGAPPAPRKKKK
jgi:large subunit ribosomal protein L21